MSGRLASLQDCEIARLLDCGIVGLRDCGIVGWVAVVSLQDGVMVMLWNCKGFTYHCKAASLWTAPGYVFGLDLKSKRSSSSYPRASAFSHLRATSSMLAPLLIAHMCLQGSPIILENMHEYLSRVTPSNKWNSTMTVQRAESFVDLHRPPPPCDGVRRCALQFAIISALAKHS